MQYHWPTWELYPRRNRHRREKFFIENWIAEVAFACGHVVQRDNTAFTFSHPRWGTMDYYAKADKICIRKSNTWHSGGLDWMKENIFI